MKIATLSLRSIVTVILFLNCYHSFSQIETKQLYLSDPSQALDRIDPVATGDGTTASTATLSTTGTAVIADNFDTNGSYSGTNSTGSLDWASDWVEVEVATTGFTDGPNTGGVLVSGNKLQMYDSGSAPYVSRRVDLSSVTSAIFSFDFTNAMNHAGDKVTIELSKDGGTTYPHVLAIFNRDTANGIKVFPELVGAFGALTATTQIRFRVTPGGSGNNYSTYDNISIAYNKPGTETFTQSPAFCSPLTIKSGNPITVSNYVTLESGTMPANPNITAVLKYGDTNIITLSNPMFSGGLLTWTGTLGSDVTVPSGQAIALQVTTAQSGVNFKIDYDSQTKPSKVEFTTSTFIEMTSYKAYNAPYPGGTIITSAEGGSMVYLRAVVTDPFGAYDITELSIDKQGTPVTATNVATTSCTKTYEYALFTPSTTGTYSYPATAKAGYENTVTDSETLNLTITTPKIDFDGIDDHIDFRDVHDFTGSFSLEAWVLQKTTVANGSIISKGNTKAGNKRGYKLSLINNYPNLTWYDALGNALVNLTSPYQLPNNKWYHIASTFNGATAKLYVDGLEVNQVAISIAPLNGSEPFIIGAIYDSDTPNTPKNYFNGCIDEVRTWDVALTEQQIRGMMNQEIEQNGTFVKGAVIPLDISSGLLWCNLKGYYSMNDNTANDKSGNNSYGIKKNINTIQIQTAPLPYTTKADGNWTDVTATTPWTLGNSVWNYPNAKGIDGSTPIDWNIVVTNHNVNINVNTSVLGLVVNSNELQVNGTTNMATGTGTGNALYVTNYLKINGVLDLEGESQLLQPNNSIYDNASTGRLERDQQGTQDLYTYNYWSSPVRFTNASTSFTLPQVFKDGTTPIGTPSTPPPSITYLTSGYNGATSPSLSIADYWIWKYANLTYDNYYAWQHVRSTGSLEVGEGFTMKGVASSGSSFTSFQNYVFTGKPNNGDITRPITAGNEYFVGNPYPSAMDADEFIRDNIKDGGNNANNVINGALYFWEHFASNTHLIKEYQGGYGIYTLMGSTQAISSDSRIKNSGALVSTKGAPGRYIPVGQGFFVNATLDPALLVATNNPVLISPITGSNILFQNDQRVFITEASASSTFMKSPNVKNKTADSENENVDTRQKIRLNMDSPKGYHRQLLVGADENASNNFDIGYDAPLIEDNTEDMFWIFNDANFIIQAVNNFDAEQTLPLGLKISKAGLASIKIDALENIENNQDIYFHDKELNVYHNLKESDYEVYLTVGKHLDRFEITFSANTASKILGTNTMEALRLLAYYSNENTSIILYNPGKENIESVELFNIIGQSTYRLDSVGAKIYSALKTKNLNEGSYILNIKMANGHTVSKKVLVKN